MLTLTIIIGILCAGMFYIVGPIGILIIGVTMLAFGVTNKDKINN